MQLSTSWWTGLVHVFQTITFSTTNDVGALQQSPLISDHFGNAHDSLIGKPHKGPVFYPPSGYHEQIQCDYTALSGYKFCSTEGDRSCWLKGRAGDQNYTIYSDYENVWPHSGVTRKYYLEVEETSINPDGTVVPNAKLFNGSYPGPWIQACWGDDLEITVKNNLKHNGTTIHWHGIRQLNTTEMDGVNGVTQCPIAPGKTFTYKFKALQYGTSWYHSHYSLQYGDGLLGPMTIHGPSSDDYDVAFPPTLMTDWTHEIASEIWYQSQILNDKTKILKSDNILVNGQGLKAGDEHAPRKYILPAQRRTRYLMRLINTSVDTTFVFAIDNHKIRVIGADFVPIKPYTTDHVLVGIGQRYHVIVEAQPTEVSEDGNYWIRFIPANGCDGLKNKVTTTLGIFRYEEDGHSNKTEPTTSQGDYSLKCHDEPYDSLVPILPWKVGPPINTAQNSQFEIALENVTGAPYFPADVTSRWNMFTDSLWINFSDPTLLHTGDASHIFKPSYVVINQTQSTNSWVYLLVSGTGIPKKGGFYPFVAHPIHLHGHDFAILEQSAQEYRIGNLNLNLNNPPRRDVALLPAKGYLVLAFKTDNPGAWLMHCHIAWHASSGLGLQILENPNNVVLSEESNNNMHQQCADWQEYLDSEEAQFLQDDSGV